MTSDYSDDPALYEYVQTLIFRPQLLRFFEDLRQKSHALYALLMHAPHSVVWIDHDDYTQKGKCYSIAAFCALPEQPDKRPEQLRLWIAGYCFLDERGSEETRYDPFCGRSLRMFLKRADLTLERIMEEFPGMLAYLCREAMLAGQPIVSDPETIGRYGFTTEDIEWLRKPLARCNTKLLAEFREQYEALSAIARLFNKPENRDR